MSSSRAQRRDPIRIEKAGLLRRFAPRKDEERLSSWVQRHDPTDVDKAEPNNWVRAHILTLGVHAAVPRSSLDCGDSDPCDVQSSSKTMPIIFEPASTKVVPPVIPLARSEQRKAAVLPISSIVTVRRSGADFSA